MMASSFRDFRNQQRGQHRTQQEAVVPEDARSGVGGGGGALSAVLAQARKSGNLSLSNRSMGPQLPAEVLQLHSPANIAEVV